MLQVRHVALRSWFALRASLPHIGNDADDGQPFRRIKRTKDPPADGILSAERFANQSLIDQCDKRLAAGIVVCEVPAAFQSNPERSERSRRHDVFHGCGSTHYIRLV